jgi:D-alanine-D-alanine ligase-like ATP-grasp enzyme
MIGHCPVCQGVLQLRRSESLRAGNPPGHTLQPQSTAREDSVIPRRVLKPNVYEEVRRLALGAHQAPGCRRGSRADFRYDGRMEGTQGVVCHAVNARPGMTETSLVPALAAYAGRSFEELVRWMVEDASLDR